MLETSLSKTLAYFLRHAPDEAGLEMDKHGFVPANQLVDVLRQKGWNDLTVETLIETVEDPSVERFQVAGERIRAKYGHSIDVNYDLPTVNPDKPVYHGTSRRAWKSIQNEGIQPMARGCVHLSYEPSEARRVGLRHDRDPVILEINVPDEKEVEWLDAGPVILAKQIPPGWIDRWDDS